MKNKIIQIALDGPAGTGKTTIAKMLSKHLNITYFSTGKIFRSYALSFLKNNININDLEQISIALDKVNLEIKDNKFYLDGNNITNLLDNENIASIASSISKLEIVREAYKHFVKKFTFDKSIVMDGRDIGSVIMPNANYKFYLDASAETRANRRLKEQNLSLDNYQEILKNIKDRDYADMTRKIAPLKKMPEAILINTDNKTVEEVFNNILKYIR